MSAWSDDFVPLSNVIHISVNEPIHSKKLPIHKSCSAQKVMAICQNDFIQACPYLPQPTFLLTPPFEGPDEKVETTIARSPNQHNVFTIQKIPSEPAVVMSSNGSIPATETFRVLCQKLKSHDEEIAELRRELLEMKALPNIRCIVNLASEITGGDPLMVPNLFHVDQDVWEDIVRFKRTINEEYHPERRNPLAYLKSHVRSVIQSIEVSELTNEEQRVLIQIIEVLQNTE